MTRAGYVLEFEDTFAGATLDSRRWIPHYLPHWSTPDRSRARYEVSGGELRLLIEADQQPWCPSLDGELRVSSLQTGVFAEPVGSRLGTHPFHPDALVRTAVPEQRLYTPTYGRVELRCRAIADPRCMVALWMIGLGDEPAHSGEICVCEIFGSEISDDGALVGMGVHPFGDPGLVDEFEKVPVAFDVCEFHTYAADWTPERVEFSIDGSPVKTVAQSLAYPLVLMLDVYEFPGEPQPASAYPKVFAVDCVRGYRHTEKLSV